MHHRSTTTLTTLFALAACTSSSSKLTGSYIGGDDSGPVMMQVATVKDHQIAGTMTVVSVDQAGKVTAVSKPVGGSIDAKLVNLSVETGSGISLMTGTIDGGAMDLTVYTGDASQKIHLQKRDPADFAAMTEDVRHRSAVIKQEAAARDAHAAQSSRIDADQRQIVAFSQDVAAKAGNVAESVVQIDRTAGSYEVRAATSERLAKADPGPVDRPGYEERSERIADAKQRNADAARSQHDAASETLTSLDAAVRQREARAQALTATCAASPELDCRGLTAAMTIYLSRAADLRKAVAREATAYRAAASRL